MNNHQSAIPFSGSSLARGAKTEPVEVLFNPFTRQSLYLSFPVWVALTFVKVYQILIPRSLKRQCIYEPTCSRFAIIVIRRDGLLKGICSTVARLRRCDGSKFPPSLDLP